MSFTPSKVSVPFTLKNNLRYEGSHITSYTKNEKFALYSSVMTYRKGNVVYMIPIKVAVCPMRETIMSRSVRSDGKLIGIS